MPKLPGVNHLQAVKAFERAGFVIIRQSKHIIMARGNRMIVIPRHNPVQALTMGSIVREAGLSIQEFKELL